MFKWVFWGLATISYTIAVVEYTALNDTSAATYFMVTAIAEAYAGHLCWNWERANA